MIKGIFGDVEVAGFFEYIWAHFLFMQDQTWKKEREKKNHLKVFGHWAGGSLKLFLISDQITSCKWAKLLQKFGDAKVSPHPYFPQIVLDHVVVPAVERLLRKSWFKMCCCFRLKTNFHHCYISLANYMTVASFSLAVWTRKNAPNLNTNRKLEDYKWQNQTLEKTL